jgi:carbon monoxide dehydrogenase subunit G
VHVAHEVALTAAPEALWNLLWDVPRMVGCVPGCVDAKEIEAHRRYTARMQQKVGMISLSVPLEVEIVDAQPRRRLALHARGRDPIVGAEIAMLVTLAIEDRAGGSALRIEADGRVLGKLGALGHEVIQRKAQEALQEFGTCLQQAAGG